MIRVTIRHGEYENCITLPANPYSIESLLGSVGLRVYSNELPVTGTEDVGVELNATNDVGAAIIETALRRPERVPTVVRLNDTCQYIQSLFPSSEYSELPIHLREDDPITLSQLRTRALYYAESRLPCLFRVPIGPLVDDLRLPCTGQMLWQVLERQGFYSEDAIKMGDVVFIPGEKMKPDSVTWPSKPVALNNLAHRMMGYLFHQGADDECCSCPI